MTERSDFAVRGNRAVTISAHRHAARGVPMSKIAGTRLEKSAQRLLAELAGGKSAARPGRMTGRRKFSESDAESLIAAELAERHADNRLAITAAGRSHLARLILSQTDSAIDPFRGQHLALSRRTISTPEGKKTITLDEAESPLAWLARRKDRDGRPLISPHQLLAGERLRGEFTRAQMMPHTTAKWESPVAASRRGGDLPFTFTETAVAARQRIRKALGTVGPEFSGLLLDICCFLKGLEDVERERGWPARSGKVVLQLALDRLARHYGLSVEVRGAPRPQLQAWLAPDDAFSGSDNSRS